MTTLHIKRGIEFQRDLYNSRDRRDWLQAAGQELEKRGATLKLGAGTSAITLKNASDLLYLYEKYQKDPKASAQSLGIPEGRPLHDFIADLVQALDDVVKPTSSLQSGDVVDLSTSGALAKTLGLTDQQVRYGSLRTEFGKTAPPAGTMNVLGVRLARVEASVANPLHGVPFMDATTFGGTRSTTGRNSLEYEAVRKLEGIEPQELVNLMRSERGGRSILARARKPEYAEAFSVGYAGVGLDEMRWDRDAVEVRAKNPYVSLTVESGRLEKDENDKRFEVSQGTDFFWDRYYVAQDPARPGHDALLENDMMVRARVRYDEAGTVRRILVQSKTGTEIDENGVKSAGKADVRRDSPAESDILNLDKMTRSGTANWSWMNQKTPIEAMEMVYGELRDKGELASVGPLKDVLLLDVGAHVFSVRSRYHLNETNASAQLTMYQECMARAQEAVELVKTASDALPAEEKKALVQLGEQVLDHSLLLTRTQEKLAQLAPGTTVDLALIEKLLPSQARSSSKTECLQRRVVAETLAELTAELGEKVYDSRRAISGDRSPDARQYDMEEEFMDFVRGRDPALAFKQTPAAFLQKLDDVAKSPEKEAFFQEFGAWLKTEHSESRFAEAPDLDAAIAGLRKNLVREHIEVLSRQVGYAGVMAKSLWFDDARRTFANSFPTTGNFLIDTFDFVSDIKPAAWDALDAAQKDGRQPIPADQIYHADVVAEVQIELGYEKPYLTAIAKAKTALHEARAGLFMDFALSDAANGCVSDKPETFVALQQKWLALPQEQQSAELERLNAFAKAMGSPLSVDADGLRRFSTETFRAELQHQPGAGHADLVRDLEMNQWIWSTLVTAQESIAEMRGERIVREAERAGHNDVSWVNSDMSKGETALRALR